MEKSEFLKEISILDREQIRELLEKDPKAKIKKLYKKMIYPVVFINEKKDRIEFSTPSINKKKNKS